MHFQYLTHFMKTLSVIAHSNAGSERVFSVCRKIDTDAPSQLCNDTLHAVGVVQELELYPSFDPRGV